MDLPIACTLSEAELRQRRRDILESFRRLQVSVKELPDGYAYSFAATREALLQVAQLVDLERGCCPFLSFKIVVEAAGPMRLEVTGPGESKAVIADYFNIEAL
jgi:hypothetical protein